MTQRTDVALASLAEASREALLDLLAENADSVAVKELADGDAATKVPTEATDGAPAPRGEDVDADEEYSDASGYILEESDEESVVDMAQPQEDAGAGVQQQERNGPYEGTEAPAAAVDGAERSLAAVCGYKGVVPVPGVRPVPTPAAVGRGKGSKPRQLESDSRLLAPTLSAKIRAQENTRGGARGDGTDAAAATLVALTLEGASEASEGSIKLPALAQRVLDRHPTLVARLSASAAATARKRPSAWAIRAAEDLYDDRYAAEVADLEGAGAAAARSASEAGAVSSASMVAFVRRRAKKAFGVRALWERHVWELALSMESLANGPPGAEADAASLFFQLLHPDTPREAITFFLFARQHLLRTLSRAVSPVRTRPASGGARAGASGVPVAQGGGAALLLARPSLRSEVAEGVVAASMGSAPRLMRVVMRLVKGSSDQPRGYAGGNRGGYMGSHTLLRLMVSAFLGVEPVHGPSDEAKAEEASPSASSQGRHETDTAAHAEGGNISQHETVMGAVSTQAGAVLKALGNWAVEA